MFQHQQLKGDTGGIPPLGLGSQRDGIAMPGGLGSGRPIIPFSGGPRTMVIYFTVAIIDYLIDERNYLEDLRFMTTGFLKSDILNLTV